MQKQAPALSAQLEKTFGEISIVNSWKEINASARTALDILVTDFLHDNFEKASTKRPVTILYTTYGLETYIELFQQGYIKHQVIRDEEDNITEVLKTIQKIVTQDIWGIDKYVGETHPIIQHRFYDSEAYYTLLDEIDDFVQPFLKNPRFLEAIHAILEELFMNAFYCAPINKDGTHPFIYQDRAKPVKLPEEKPVLLNYAFDGRNLFLSVCDLYGSFEYPILIESLSHYFQGTVQVNKGEGGAGLGLMELFRNTTGLIVNVEKGVRTEMIACLDLAVRYSKFVRLPRSLNIFHQIS